MNDRHRLRWTTESNPPPSLPSHVTRVFVSSPSGPLELLVAKPTFTNAPRKRALFFQHGGFGCASVWLPFLTYFSQNHGHPCYALSVRGHGESWKPSVLRMMFLTGKKDFALDLLQGLNWAKVYEAGTRGCVEGYDDIVLVGHSAGGGLSQYFLGEGMGRVGALCVMGSFPPFSGYRIFLRWQKLDPWSQFRMFFRDFGHPRSSLSSTTLVHRAFFCPAFPRNEVRRFEGLMAELESFRWAVGMFGSYVKVPGVLRNILGWGFGKGQRVLVVAGENDTVIGTELPLMTANAYRGAWKALVKGGAIEGNISDAVSSRENDSSLQKRDGVIFAVINGSGHHIQNDLQWEKAAAELLSFVEQL